MSVVFWRSLKISSGPTVLLLLHGIKQQSLPLTRVCSRRRRRAGRGQWKIECGEVWRRMMAAAAPMMSNWHLGLFGFEKAKLEEDYSAHLHIHAQAAAAASLVEERWKPQTALLMSDRLRNGINRLSSSG